MMPAIDRNVVLISNRASKTSRDAANKVLPKTGSMRRSVYDYIAANGQAADFQLEDFLNDKHQSVSASRRSLVVDGFLMDSGRTIKNREGNECTLWVLAPINERLF